jgi:hypothetical protein
MSQHTSKLRKTQIEIEIMHHDTIYVWKDLSRKAKASQIHNKKQEF